MAEKRSDAMTREEKKETSRRQQPAATPRGPFGALQRFAEDVERFFDDFGMNRSGVAREWRSPFAGLSGADAWAPSVDMFQRDNELVVRADLPGLDRNDVKVDVNEDAICIQGERRHERDEEHEGVYRSERTYGSFYREIPLPEGVMTDQAKAHFKNGVLEITMPAPPQHVTRGRRIEIAEGPEPKK